MQQTERTTVNEEDRLLWHHFYERRWLHARAKLSPPVSRENSIHTGPALGRRVISMISDCGTGVLIPVDTEQDMLAELTRMLGSGRPSREMIVRNKVLNTPD